VASPDARSTAPASIAAIAVTEKVFQRGSPDINRAA
jgi:hypothetical protein